MRRVALWGGPPRRVDVVVSAVLLLVPGIVAAVAAVRYGWQPVADEGTIVTRAHDVLSRRSPLVGQYSLASDRGGPATHSPGPLLYWLLAGPVRLGPILAVPLAMVAFNTACMVGTALVAGWWGGRVPLYVTTAGLLVLVRAWGGYQLFAPWNPSAVLLPFVALVVVTWAVACGAHRLLPVVVVLVTLCVQSHLTFAVPGLWLSVVATGAVVVPLVVGRAGLAESDRRDRLRSSALAAAVAVVCWAPPLLQQLRVDPGNLALLLRSTGGGSEVLGPRRGANALVRILAGPPVWLRAEGTASTGFLKLDLAVSRASEAVAVGLVVILVVLVVRASRRGERAYVALGAITGGLLPAGWLVASQIPSQRAFILGYSLWWVSAVGILTWAVVLGGAAREVLLLRRARRSSVGEPDRVPSDRPALADRPGRSVRRRWAVGVAVAALAVVVAVATPVEEDLAWAYEPARLLGDAAVASAQPGQRYLLGFGPLHIDMAPPVAHRLRAAGAEPVLPQTLGPATGRGYAPRGERCAGVFRLLPAVELAGRARAASEVVVGEAVIVVPRRPPTRYVLTLADDERTSC